MNKSGLIKLEKRLRKASRTSFICGVVVLMALMVIVILSKIGGQPVDQNAIAKAGTPLVIALAAITGLCRFFQSSVAARIRRLQQ